MRVCPTGPVPVKAHALVVSAGFEHPALAVAPRTFQGRRRSQINQLLPSTANASSPFGIAQVIAKVTDAAFGKPLVTNVLRGQVVEAMIALALEPVWQWCSADYSSWDFEHSEGLRLEVKQSAARQSWETSGPSKAVFDVAARTGRYERTGWIAEHGRAAHVYVFARHSVYDDSADHRDPAQWQFYVVPTTSLPDVKQIGLGAISTLAEPMPITLLAEAVASVAARIPVPARGEPAP